jgi:hypothetical protein
MKKAFAKDDDTWEDPQLEPDRQPQLHDPARRKQAA